MTIFATREYHRMNPFFSSETRVVVAVAALLVVVATPLLGGCDEGIESPEDVVRSFLGDLRAGETQQALDAVWPETRRELLSGYDELEMYFEEDPPMERMDLMVVTRVESPMVISRIRAVDDIPQRPEDGQRVTLKIELRGDRAADIDVVWGADQQRWFVDLPLDDRRSLQVLDDGDEESEADDEADEGSDG